MNDISIRIILVLGMCSWPWLEKVPKFQREQKDPFEITMML